jgi:hypothetical protein
MPLQCNINSQGKRFRLITGIITLLIGLLLLFLWSIPTSSPLSWIISSITVLSGLFAIFEARAGWCALRAMGFKTRI